MVKSTKEEKEAIEEWFIHEYWPTYPGKWCRGGKGSRSTCLKLFTDKWKPDAEERVRILGNLKAQILHNRKLPENQRPWWKMCDTYTRNGLWEDEIEPISEPIRVTLAGCVVCGKEVHGPRYDKCTDHVMQHHGDRLGKASQSKLRKQVLQDKGLYEHGLTLRETAQKCRQHLKSLNVSYGSILKTSE